MTTTATPDADGHPARWPRALIDLDALAASRRRQRPTTPTALGRRLLGTRYRTTPAVALIGAAVADAISQPDARLIVTVPPREAKSTTVAVLGTVLALATDPDAEVILASYADNLAHEHSARARALIAEHGDDLGIRLADEKTAVGRWRIAGHRGGLLATGIMAGITGKGADLLILDDIVKNAAEADSDAHRRRVLAEFRGTLMTRVHPGGSVVIIGTRWHPDDLIGHLLATEPERWEHLNIPAVAEAGIPDALHRPPGQTMTSTVGRSPEQFADLRRSLGDRSWYAEFQGVPNSPEGNLIRSTWLDSWRLPSAPVAPALTVVGVDPSDSGEGDAAGIVAASLTRDGVVAVIADQSAPMTSDQWARAAIELAMSTGASEIAIEAFTARATYERVVREAMARYDLPHPIRVTTWPPKGEGGNRGDALARSAALLQAFEVGTCRIAGHLPEFERRAVTWQAGTHQPDALAALVVAHDVLIRSAGSRLTFGVPVSDPVSLAAYLGRRVSG
ncbi:terminase large subunit domain-containing protein [[Mycobacterium] crassicus]|uniref:Terminase family protein n=1 Tax=[Mycobacterium] crassicus TaxID=2872309 RepID=A0ABU5XF11_9MYCO|nr:terminase family protein [Mycolicibacter sp. MYC098]MEB3020888.1 terminase family protein [Mycolicibacter sp. MYC098]